jgi:uncharacterized protein YeaO (DUF488 family)
VPIRTKRWNDPVEADDGFRLLVCRIRPRGVARARETWTDWWPDLGPSRALLDDYHGKHGPAATWAEYVPRYLQEMHGATQLWRIRDLARRSAAGEVITLLCSSACTDPERCHRSLLASLISGRPG